MLPRYECLEVMDEGEFVEADDTSLGGGGPADHSVQLAAALRERGRSVPRAGAARLVQRRAVHQRDGLDAAGDIRDVAARRHGALDAQDRRRQDFLSRDRGRAADAAGRAQSARRPIRARRIDRLGAADRRYVVPHLCGGPRQAKGRPRPHALEVQRQVLVGHDRGGAPEATPATTRRRSARARSRCIPRNISRRATAAS